jgi:hypothetical protein
MDQPQVLSMSPKPSVATFLYSVKVVSSPLKVGLSFGNAILPSLLSKWLASTGPKSIEYVVGKIVELKATNPSFGPGVKPDKMTPVASVRRFPVKIFPPMV